MKFAAEAVGVVVPFLVVSVTAWLIGLATRSAVSIYVGGIAALVGLVLLMFFRDPERHPPEGNGLVVSPADGKVIVVESLPDDRKHIAIFLSVFDTHVNRVPIGCVVTEVAPTPGSYFHAGTSRAAEGNARVDVKAESSFGSVGWRQLSGSIARKISCRLKPGDSMQTGQRFGLIYFGSRMDVYLPSTAHMTVKPRQRVLAGESVIARFEGDE